MITMTSDSVAGSSRALLIPAVPTQGYGLSTSPAGLTVTAVDSWADRGRTTVHNSIAATAAAPAQAGFGTRPQGVAVAAKPAAPPRGVPC